jgi:hypothetical protein
VDEERKFEPVTVSVVVALPATVELGLIDAMTGAGKVKLVIVNVWLPEVPPPGAALVTVTGSVPVAVMFPDGTVP